MLSITPEHKYNVLDGKQRYTAIIEFLQNKFRVNNCFFKDLDVEIRFDFVNQRIPVSVSDGLTDDDEATIFERINRAQKLSEGERMDSYFKSPVALERDSFFREDNPLYKKLVRYFGPYTVSSDKRKGHLANQTATIVIFADGTLPKTTFETIQYYLEMTENEWEDKKVAFQYRIKEFVQLWSLIVDKYDIQLPESWKKPSKLWKHSFLTSYIVHSMVHDPSNYVDHWVRFIKALSEDSSVYTAWPHTTVSRVNASVCAKQSKCQFAQGYYQVRYYNSYGYFDTSN